MYKRKFRMSLYQSFSKVKFLCTGENVNLLKKTNKFYNLQAFYLQKMLKRQSECIDLLKKAFNNNNSNTL